MKVEETEQSGTAELALLGLLSQAQEAELKALEARRKLMEKVLVENSEGKPSRLSRALSQSLWFLGSSFLSVRQAASLQKSTELIVFCLLAILGVALVTLLSLTHIDWFYPTLIYGAIVYVAWQQYL